MSGSKKSKKGKRSHSVKTAAKRHKKKGSGAGGGPAGGPAVQDLDALFNGYSLPAAKTVVVPQASALAKLQLKEATFSGTLLPKTLVKIDHATGQRVSRLAGQDTANAGVYTVEENDGDIHFCVGTSANAQTHVPCELQNAAAQLVTFNQSIGQPISVSGFLRCLFEHPGFGNSPADAHIFEIHPVRTFTVNGTANTTDIDSPPVELHDWSDRLNTADAGVNVQYDQPTDTLTFTGVPGMDTNYVKVDGTVSGINLGDAATPAEFTLTSAAIPNPVRCVVLQGTRAVNQLRTLANGDQVSMVGLRNIDLEKAKNNNIYSICLLAIDMGTG